jgi:hypothetical protein
VGYQDIALWAAYAVVEAAAGNIDTARKVLDTTLTSLPSLPSVCEQISGLGPCPSLASYFQKISLNEASVIA